MHLYNINSVFICGSYIKHSQNKMAARFKIDTSKQLGSGSYGAVFSGTMTLNHKTTPVAVKRIQNDGKGNVYRENAEKEYDALKGVGSHTNIVRLLNFTHDKNFIYIYMELGDQGNLEEFLNTGSPDMQLKVRIMNDCSSAIAFMHSRNPAIIHRDIKPANVIIQTDGANHTAKLVDFGLSKIFAEDQFFMSTDVGTLAYRAPELFIRGRKQYTPSIDTFSMGLLYLVVFNFDSAEPFMEPTPAHIKHQPFLPYGQRLLQAKDEKRRAPELFTEFTADLWPHKDLKTMVTSMVCFHPSERTDMSVVETLLNNITMLFQERSQSRKSTSTEVQQLTQLNQHLEHDNIQLINDLTQQLEIEQQQKRELNEELILLRQQQTTAAGARTKTREIRKSTPQTSTSIRKLPSTKKSDEKVKVSTDMQSPAHVYQHTSGVRVEVIQADVTTLTVDAGVILSNRDLSPFRAVDTSVHRAAGAEVRRECEEALARHGGRMRDGDVVVTSAGRLPWKHIIHCVLTILRPFYYKKALQEAVSRGCESVALTDDGFIRWYSAASVISSFLAESPRRGLQVIRLVSEDSHTIQRWRRELDEEKTQGNYT